MKHRALKCIAVCALFMSLSFAAVAQERDMQFVLGAGLVISPDYSDLLDQMFDSVSGGYGWLDIQLGLRFAVGENLSIMPGADVLMNVGMGSVSFFNTIILPEVSVQYLFKEAPSFYVQGGLNYGIVNMDAEFDAPSGGVGFEAAVGYAFSERTELELGYLNIPVGDLNMGGFLLRYKGSF